MVNSTLTDVEAKEDVSYDALIGILDRLVATTVDLDALGPFATIGINEIALQARLARATHAVSGRREVALGLLSRGILWDQCGKRQHWRRSCAHSQRAHGAGAYVRCSSFCHAT
jgi:hypothetical protein